MKTITPDSGLDTRSPEEIGSRHKLSLKMGRTASPARSEKAPKAILRHLLKAFRRILPQPTKTIARRAFRIILAIKSRPQLMVKESGSFKTWSDQNAFRIRCTHGKEF